MIPRERSARQSKWNRPFEEVSVGERYQVCDEAVIAQNPSVVFGAIADFARHKEWWPWRFLLRVWGEGTQMVGRKLEFSPAPVIRTGWEIVAVEPDVSIDVRYHRGPHEGTGRFEFIPHENGCLLRYTIDIMPKSWFWSVVYKLVNVPKKHSRDIQGLFRRLDGYLRG